MTYEEAQKIYGTGSMLILDTQHGNTYVVVLSDQPVWQHIEYPENSWYLLTPINQQLHGTIVDYISTNESTSAITIPNLTITICNCPTLLHGHHKGCSYGSSNNQCCNIRHHNHTVASRVTSRKYYISHPRTYYQLVIQRIHGRCIAYTTVSISTQYETRLLTATTNTNHIRRIDEQVIVTQLQHDCNYSYSSRNAQSCHKLIVSNKLK